MSFDFVDYKKDFPLLMQQDVAYLDSAATAQRPASVLQAEKEFYEQANANPLRGLYELGVEATDRYEAARERVRKFLNARREDLLRHIYRFQYQLNGGTWYTGEINSKEVVGTNVVVFVNMPSSGAADTVTAVRVYDNNDSLAGSQSVNLKRQSYNTGLLRFTFPLIEATTE